MMRHRLRLLAVNLALVLATVALFGVALELGLRWFGPREGDWYASGPERLRFLRDHVQRNSLRFRDREFTPRAADGVLRILAVGDSFTFGDGIEDVDDTWPRVLESELNRAGTRCEVFNLGVPGTGTAFQRRLLLDRGYALRPDRIVLGFVLNDPEPPDANQDVVPRLLNPPLLPFPRLDAALGRISYAYSWLKRKKNRLLERLELKPTYGGYVHGLYEDGEDWTSFVREARGLVADAALRGVPVTVAVFPMFHRLDAYPFREEHRRASEVFREAGADVLDLLGAFESARSNPLSVSPTNAHPNESAHRIAARALADHLWEARD